MGVGNPQQTQRELIDALKDVASELKNIGTGGAGGGGGGQGGGGVDQSFGAQVRGLRDRKIASVQGAVLSTAGKALSKIGARAGVNFLRGQSLTQSIVNAGITAGSEIPVLGELIREGVTDNRRAAERTAGLLGPIARAGGSFSRDEIKANLDFFKAEEARASTLQRRIDDIAGESLGKDAVKEGTIGDELAKIFADIEVGLSESSIKEIGISVAKGIGNIVIPGVTPFK